MIRKIIIGSRGSDLALWQAHYVQNQLTKLGCQSEIQIIKTQGDKIQHLSFEKMEGKGFFTKEIEESLINKNIDLAIHSHKDLETNQPVGLKIAAVSYRENPAELLLIRKNAVDALQPMQLKVGAVLGTSAARRKSQFTFYRPDIDLKDLRGNVPTRVEKLRQGQYDAILLAAAGVTRLNLDLSDFEVVELDPRIFIPAPAQGVLAYQIRENDDELAVLLNKINDKDVAEAIGVERKILNLLHGGCQVPFGAFCKKDSDGFHLWAYYGKDETSKRRLYLHGLDSKINFEKVLFNLQENQSKTALITRSIGSGTGVKKLLQDSGIQVIDQSFINIQSVESNQVSFTDFQWLFFTSPNAVEHFGQFDKVSGTILIGALGRGTAAAILAKGFQVSFQGDGTTEEVAADFNKVLNQNRVLVICAENGLRNFQKALSQNSFEEMAVYRTDSHAVKINDEPDFIAFTSPSNVKGFFELNTLPKNCTVIAIGTTTLKSLEEMGITNAVLVWQSSEQAIADTILGLA